MKNFLLWLRLLGHWIRRVPVTGHYWAVLALVIASVFLVGCACGWSEQAFRLAGMGLQLLGILCVGWGISKTRKDFKQLTWSSLCSSWLKAFPKFPPRTISGSGFVTLPSLRVKGYGVGGTLHGPSTDETVEGRLQHLESSFKKWEAALGETRVAVFRAEEKAEQALSEQARQLAGKIGDVSKEIEIAATSGIHIAVVGAILLFVGTIFGTVAQELSEWLA